MNKEYKYINNEIIELKDEKGNLIQRKVNCNNPTEVLELENKIEILNNMIKSIDKKINSRKEYKKFAPLWIKVHMILPPFTIILFIISCFTGWIYKIYYPFLLPCFVYSTAIIFTSIIAGIGIYLTNKDINGLISKLETSKEMKNDLERQLLIKLSEELKSTKTNQNELNQSYKLREELSLAEEKVLSYAYSNGFHQKNKKLVKSKENNFTR